MTGQNHLLGIRGPSEAVDLEEWKKLHRVLPFLEESRDLGEDAVMIDDD